MAEFNFDADDMDIAMELGSTGGDGPDLTGYPCLVYAPQYWGPGVRLEDTGTPIDDIAHAYAAERDITNLARQFSTDRQHIREALAYQAAGLNPAKE